MKYIVWFKENMNRTNTIPYENRYDLISDTHPYFERLREERRILDWGFVSAGRQAYATFEVSTHAELHELTELCPLRPLCTVDSYPVMDAKEFSKTFDKINPELKSRYNKIENHRNERTTR